MRADFAYASPHYLTPATLGRLLVDIDGLVFLGFVLGDPYFRKQLGDRSFNLFSYKTYIYLHGPQEEEHALDADFSIPGKVMLERVTYQSPPKIEISVHASLDAQKVIKTILDFVRGLLILKEQKLKLRAEAAKARQEVLSMEIANAREMMALLENVDDDKLRERLKQALVSRMDPMLNGRDYPALDYLQIRGPGT